MEFLLGIYVYATYKKTHVTTNEAEAWEAAKKACGGLHFLAIQEDLDSDDCVGFWLLQTCHLHLCNLQFSPLNATETGPTALQMNDI
jgi:hypothetical protein